MFMLVCFGTIIRFILDTQNVLFEQDLKNMYQATYCYERPESFSIAQHIRDIDFNFW